MIVNIFNFVIEYIKLMLFTCGILNFRYRSSPASKIAFGLGLVCTALGSYFVSEEYAVLFSAVVIPVVCLAVDARIKILPITLGFLVICCLDDGFAGILKRIFHFSDNSLQSNPYLFSAFNSASLVLLTACALVMHHLYNTEKFKAVTARNFSTLYIILLIIGQGSALIFLAPFTYTEYQSTLRNNVLVGGSACILSILFFIIGLLMMYYNSSRNYYRKLSDFNHELSLAQQKYYQTLLQKEHETRKFRHDISNHLLCVASLLEEQKIAEAEEYISKLNGSISKLRPTTQTGNMLVNIILSDMMRKYRTVTPDWSGHVPEHLLVSDMDICTILSNIFENAFYSASLCEGEKKVSVSVRILASTLSITVKNPVSVPVRRNQKCFLTQKSDKQNHGYGILNVQNAVERNKGIVNFHYSDTDFLAEIVLPNAVDLTAYPLS
ncbi:MAG: GHKL domain-containing protein [Oscillospiraceae bacterium]|nr:GHKL domain-containing protein [Oscillospiraceae bacterium]